VLVGNRDYPNIVEDYMATYAKARSLGADVFLGSHGFWFDLARKYELLQSRGPSDPNPYIDPRGYQAHIDLQEARFRDMLAEQRGSKR
jgi:metallo-beta-lactamase class B